MTVVLCKSDRCIGVWAVVAADIQGWEAYGVLQWNVDIVRSFVTKSFRICDVWDSVLPFHFLQNLAFFRINKHFL